MIFKAGDRVICLTASSMYPGVLGHVYTVERVTSNEDIVFTEDSLHYADTVKHDKRNGSAANRFAMYEAGNETKYPQKGDTVRVVRDQEGVVTTATSHGFYVELDDEETYFSNSDKNVTTTIVKRAAKIVVGSKVCSKFAKKFGEKGVVQYIFSNKRKMLVMFEHNKEESERLISDYEVVEG